MIKNQEKTKEEKTKRKCLGWCDKEIDIDKGFYCPKCQVIKSNLEKSLSKTELRPKRVLT